MYPVLALCVFKVGRYLCFVKTSREIKVPANVTLFDVTCTRQYAMFHIFHIKGEHLCKALYLTRMQQKH